MKLINKCAFILIFTISLTACSKSYLDTAPTNAVSEADVFKTTKNAWAAINGIDRNMYVQWRANSDEGGYAGLMIDIDMLGEDVVNTTTGNGWFIATARWQDHRNVSSRLCSFSYSFLYDQIFNANKIIANIAGAEGSESEKKAIKGEALTYRAWAHFMLVQLFGKRYDGVAKPNNQLGVPVRLNNEFDALPRSSVEDVYIQVNKDLDEAIVALTGAQVQAKSHMNVWVAKGLKARVALTMQNYTDASKYANEAIAAYQAGVSGGGLMTSTQYTQGFNSVSNPEWMWGSYVQDDQGIYFYSFFAFMSSNFGSSNIKTDPKAINSKLYNTIAVADVRKGLWDPTGTNTSFIIPAGGTRKPYMNKKFVVKDGSSSVGDIPYMRIAEMYLINAEAKARSGDNGGAATALFNMVITRDASYTLSTNTGQALIDEIMNQRRVELWGEGFRFLDLKRTNQALDRTGANHDPVVSSQMNIAAGDDKWQFLIPKDETNANPKIVQNN